MMFKKGLVLVCLVLVAGCNATLNQAVIHRTPEHDPDMSVDVYQPDKAFNGTTLLADNHLQGRSRIIEVDMLGRIVWEFPLPAGLAAYTNPGFDVEGLANGNILFVLPLKGVYEIDRWGKEVWSYIDSKVSHDADRLPNGNTLVAFGGFDQRADAQVKEIDPKGRVVWSWKAGEHFTDPAYRKISNQGWTHTNAVSRLADGHTLISLRNFNFIAEVDAEGKVVNIIGRGIFHEQHDPEVQPNGNILVMDHGRPHRAMEIDPRTNRVVWQSRGFPKSMVPVRDADRLPNGNLLITGTNKLLEYTPGGELVWRLNLNVTFSERREAPAFGFYKAERLVRGQP